VTYCKKIGTGKQIPKQEKWMLFVNTSGFREAERLKAAHFSKEKVHMYDHV
jgi:hypothetical protein